MHVFLGILCVARHGRKKSPSSKQRTGRLRIKFIAKLCIL